MCKSSIQLRKKTDWSVAKKGDVGDVTMFGVGDTRESSEWRRRVVPTNDTRNLSGSLMVRPQRSRSGAVTALAGVSYYVRGLDPQKLWATPNTDTWIFDGTEMTVLRLDYIIATSYIQGVRYYMFSNFQ